MKYNEILTLYVYTKVFPIVYVGTGSILALCTEHQLTCNCYSFNDAISVYIFAPFNVFKYTEKYLVTVFKYIKIKVFINTLINTQ